MPDMSEGSRSAEDPSTPDPSAAQPPARARQQPPKKDRRHPRHNFRARSHAHAHAESSHEGRAPAVPEIPLVPRNHPGLIDASEQYGALLDHLRSSGSFAYDSEFIGELTYHPKLCVIQVATAEQVA